MYFRMSFQAQTFNILFCLIIIKNVQAEKNVFGQVITYLKRHNDVDVGSILFLGDPECNSGDRWCAYITVEQDPPFESLPFIFLQNLFNHSVNRFDKAMSLSQKGTLVIINNFEGSDHYQEILKSLSETSLRSNIWLFLYPYSNITEQNFGKLKLNEELDAQTNLKFNSQVYHLSFRDLNSFI